MFSDRILQAKVLWFCYLRPIQCAD